MADDDAFALKIKGKRYAFNPEDLELGEAELIEDELDSPLEDIDWRRARALRCLAWILLRRENPAVTIDEVRKLRISDFDDEAASDPEDGVDDPPTVPTPTEPSVA